MIKLYHDQSCGKFSVSNTEQGPTFLHWFQMTECKVFSFHSEAWKSIDDKQFQITSTESHKTLPNTLVFELSSSWIIISKQLNTIKAGKKIILCSGKIDTNYVFAWW